MIALLAWACVEGPPSSPLSPPRLPAPPVETLHLTPTDLQPLHSALASRTNQNRSPLSIQLGPGRYNNLSVDLSDIGGVDILIEASPDAQVDGGMLVDGQKVEIRGLRLVDAGRLTVSATGEVSVKGLRVEGARGRVAGAPNHARGSLVDIKGAVISVQEVRLVDCGIPMGSLLTLEAPRVEVDRLEIAGCTAARALDLLGAQNVDLRGLTVDLGPEMLLLRPQGTMALTLRQSDITLASPRQLGLRAGMVKDEVTLHTRSP